MKKRLLYIIIAVGFLGCTKPHPNNSDVFVPEKIKTDTLYHIAAFDGNILHYDSIRIDVRHFPDHYLRWVTKDSCIVTVEGATITYDEYRDRFAIPIYSYTHAHRDTLTCTHSFYNGKDVGAWALRQMLNGKYR